MTDRLPSAAPAAMPDVRAPGDDAPTIAGPAPRGGEAPVPETIASAANDATARPPAGGADAPEPPRVDEGAADGSEDNAVRSTVREFRGLNDAMEEIRATLSARGVPRRVTNVLVELGLQKQPDRLAEAIDGAIEQAEKAHGAGSLERATLEGWIADMVGHEQDMALAREVARNDGLDVRSLAILSQLIQANPGDGGEKAVNRMLAYARACGIALDGVPRMAAELSAPPASVLPRIERGRGAPSPAASRRALLRDVLLGLLIGVVVIHLLT